jgi:hypothetical protein
MLVIFNRNHMQNDPAGVGGVDYGAWVRRSA